MFITIIALFLWAQGQCYSCGEDGSRCALMGMDADKYNIGNKTLVSFYVSTGKVAPFCGNTYSDV
jgi:hypothetical protein